LPREIGGVMRVRIAVVAVLTALAGLAVVPSAQASAVCVNAHFTANGQVLVDESHCVDLP
jgi:hypothetical protein